MTKESQQQSNIYEEALKECIPIIAADKADTMKFIFMAEFRPLMIIIIGTVILFVLTIKYFRQLREYVFSAIIGMIALYIGMKDDGRDGTCDKDKIAMNDTLLDLLNYYFIDSHMDFTANTEIINDKEVIVVYSEDYDDVETAEDIENIEQKIEFKINSNLSIEKKFKELEKHNIN